MVRQPEGLFKDRVLADIRSLPHAWAEKIQQVNLCGTPDILACINGYFVALELKKDAKVKPDQLQIYELKRIIKSGGRSYVAYPENWDTVFEQLKMLSQARKPLRVRKLLHALL